jgi:hypothetical protein
VLLDRDCAPRRSTRIIVVSIGGQHGDRLVGLLAEQVLDFIDVVATVPGLRLPATPWLADHVADVADSPQLLDPAALLPDDLERLFVHEAAA